MNASEARELFDRSSSTYAPINRVISAGLDSRWRRWVRHAAAVQPGDSALDLMTGTGEVAVDLAEGGAAVTAVDVSDKMLSAARERARRAGVLLELVHADATRDSSLPSGPFGAITVVFGLRYVDDVEALLTSLAPRLAPGGRLVLLEFCTPVPGPLATPASLYFFHVLPKLAGLFGGEPDLYRALTDTTRRMGSRRDIRRRVERAGFEVAEDRALGFGLVAGLVARSTP